MKTFADRAPKRMLYFSGNALGRVAAEQPLRLRTVGVALPSFRLFGSLRFLSDSSGEWPPEWSERRDYLRLRPVSTDAQPLHPLSGYFIRGQR